MRVRDLLKNKFGDVVTVSAGTNLATATRLLIRHGIGALPVVTDRGEVVGLLSERDVVKAVDESSGGVGHLPVERVMHRPPPVCDADASLQEIMTSMTHGRHRHLVVIENDRIAGVVSVGDLVKHRLEQLELETGVLRDYVAARRASS